MTLRSLYVLLLFALGFSACKVHTLQTATEPLNYTITFAPDPNQTYGFDASKYDQTNKETLNETDYWVAWKSIASGRTDQVIATTDKEKFPAYIGFKTPIAPLNAQQGAQENTKQVSIIGTTDGAAQELKAYAIQKTEVTEEGEDVEEKEVTLGLLNVISYDLIRNKVIIVPVNGVAAPSAALLSMELNAIYGQAVAEWEVVIDAPFSTDEDLVASLDEGESNMLSSFLANMKKFNRKFKRSRDLDKDAYYLFLVNGVQTSLSGFMPFKRQYGYIFGNIDVKTIAHELGHGAFRLRHTFSPEALVAAEGSTDNLMDYAGSEATHLYKSQWDNIHDPEKMIGWFEGDEESASIGTLAVDQSTGINTTESKTYLTPAGIPFTVPNNTTKVSFVSTVGRAPYGTLTGYWVGDAYYVAVYRSNHFGGYALLKDAANLELAKNENGEVIYEKEELTKSLGSSSLVVLGYPHKGKIYLGTKSIGLFTKPTSISHGDGDILPIDHYQSYQIETTPVADKAAENILGLPVCESLYEEYKDSPLMDSYLLANSIEGNHCLLLGMRTTGEGLGYETEFMKNLNRVVGNSLAVAFLPAAIEMLLPVLVETAASAFSESTLAQMAELVAQEKAREFAIGFTMDGVLQIALLHYFEDEPLTPAILDKLEYSQMALSGIENATNNIYAGAAISCLYDGFSSDKFIDGYRLEDFTNECAWGLASYMLAQGITKLPGLNHNLVKLKNVLHDTPLKFIAGMKNLNISDDLIVSTGKHLGFNETDLRKWLRDVNYLKNSGLPGWDKNRVLNLNKPDRPIPRTYLSEEYIRTHLGYFEETGSAFIIRKRDIIDPNAHPTLAPRKFVGLLSEMEVVFQKFKNSGDDTRILIEELDLGDNYIQQLDEVFFVKIEPGDSRFVYGIPSGNEFGAYEGLWEPGGKTKHGTLEAVLVNADQFNFSKSWDSFLEIFGRDNVIRLK